MDQNVLRTRLYWVGGGYAAVVGLSAMMIFMRYLQYAMHPADAAQYGGMWAGGDLILELFICGMLLAMTMILALVIMNDERAYTMYAKVLLGLSLTLPLSIGLILIPAVNQGVGVFGALGWVCMYRPFASPVVIVGLAASRLLARFPRPKKLIMYSLLVEVVTVVLVMASMAAPSRFHLE